MRPGTLWAWPNSAQRSALPAPPARGRAAGRVPRLRSTAPTPAAPGAAPELRRRIAPGAKGRGFVAPRARLGQNPGRDRAWGSASGRPSRRARRRVRAARLAGCLGGGAGARVAFLPRCPLAPAGQRAGCRRHEDLDFRARL